MKIITIARKPLVGTVAENVLAYGTGALNIDESRVSMQAEDAAKSARPGHSHKETKSDGVTGWNAYQMHAEQHAGGRWPANLIFSHLPGCVCTGTREVQTSWSARGTKGTPTSHVYNDFDSGFVGAPVTKHGDGNGQETVAAWSCVEGCPVAALDESAGIRTSGAMRPEIQRGRFGQHGVYRAAGGSDVAGRAYTGGSGGASRFFKQVQGDSE